MFLHVSVILFTGGGLGLCPWESPSWGSLSHGVSVLGGLCPRWSLSGGLCSGGSLSGGLCSGRCLSRGVSVRGVSVMETPRTVMSRRYASYWNAFLLLFVYYTNDSPSDCWADESVSAKSMSCMLTLKNSRWVELRSYLHLFVQTVKFNNGCYITIMVTFTVKKCDLVTQNVF